MGEGWVILGEWPRIGILDLKWTFAELEYSVRFDTPQAVTPILEYIRVRLITELEERILETHEFRQSADGCGFWRGNTLTRAARSSL